MKGTHIFISLLALSVILNLYLALDARNRTREVLTQEMEMEIESQKANAIRSQMAQEEMHQKYIQQLSYENMPLETDIPVWNQRGEKMVLQQLITNQERLILYYSTFGCTPCNNEQIAMLKEIAKEFGQERILMLVAGAEDNTLRNLKRIDKFSDQVLLRTDGTGLPSGQGSKPLLFLLGPDQEINMIYAADIDTPESNQLYRNRILSRFRSCFEIIE